MSEEFWAWCIGFGWRRFGEALGADHTVLAGILSLRNYGLDEAVTINTAVWAVDPEASGLTIVRNWAVAGNGRSRVAIELDSGQVTVYVGHEGAQAYIEEVIAAEIEHLCGTVVSSTALAREVVSEFGVSESVIRAAIYRASWRTRGADDRAAFVPVVLGKPEEQYVLLAAAEELRRRLEKPLRKVVVVRRSYSG